MFRSFRRSLSLWLILTLLTSSCRVWSVTNATPADYLRSHQPDAVRIHRHGGTQLVLMEPELLGDSLRGYAETTGRPTIALADIDSIAVRRTSWGKTIALVGGVGAAIVVAALLSDCSDARAYC